MTGSAGHSCAGTSARQKPQTNPASHAAVQTGKGGASGGDGGRGGCGGLGEGNAHASRQYTEKKR